MCSFQEGLRRRYEYFQRSVDVKSTVPFNIVLDKCIHDIFCSISVLPACHMPPLLLGLFTASAYQSSKIKRNIFFGPDFIDMYFSDGNVS